MFAIGVLLAICSARAATAATVAYLSDRELVARSQRVVYGIVTAIRVAQDPSGLIHTLTDVDVLEDFTGIAEQRVTVVELGGTVAGRSIVIPGVPRFDVGQAVVLCLEPAAHGGWRTVALSHAVFNIAPQLEGGPGQLPSPQLRRAREAQLEVVGGPSNEPATPTLNGFRTLVHDVKGTASWSAAGPAAAGLPSPEGATVTEDAEPVASAEGGSGFTLLAGGMRWNEADAGIPIRWYRSPDALAPTGGTGEPEIAVALAAWSAPAIGSIELAYAGTRNRSGSSPYCSDANAGVGLISFEDPTAEMGSNVLAVGGGCMSSTSRVINGTTFRGFSHAFVIVNRAARLAAAYRTSGSLARVLEHEIGHAIGFGHEDLSSPRASQNIMYPSCCLATTPVPPALGPDDLAGLAFVYPVSPTTSQSCAYSVSPLSSTFPSAGGSAAVAVSTSPACTWSAETLAAWIQVSDTSLHAGPGSVTYQVAGNVGAPRVGVLRVASLNISVSQTGTDIDGDGLPDGWETRFGLNPNSAAGGDGPAGDPDNDGETNAEEYANNGNPRGFFKRYFAEGATSDLFSSRFAVFNPDPSATAHVSLSARPANRRAATLAFDLAPLGRRTVTAASDLGLDRAEFATIVEADVPIVTDRTMTWTGRQQSAHGETGVAAPAPRWYFAEGATHSAFQLFYLISNPNPSDIDVEVRFILPAPSAPVVRTYSVAAEARRTVWVNVEDPVLAATDVAAVVSSVDGRGIVAERAMYLSRPGEAFSAGHADAGATSASTRWWFAEGATGGYFDTFLLISNPGSEEAVLEVRYLLPSGERVVVPHVVAASSRSTVWADFDHPRVGDTAVGMEVQVLNGVPVVAERAMMWPGPTAATWYEAHVNGGLATTAHRWATADVEASAGGSDLASFLLIINTSTRPGQAVVTVACEDTPGQWMRRTFGLAATSRRNIDVGDEFPEVRGRHCSALIESIDPVPLDLVVERSTYWSSAGKFWTAGVSVSAVPLP